MKPRSYNCIKKRSKILTETNQFIASSSPLPLIADVLNILQVLFLREHSPRDFDISAGVRGFSMSCLLANIISIEFFNSSSYYHSGRMRQWSY